jgi:hypothetical protein
MTEICLSTINFHGATLLVVPGPTPGETLVAMKPIVEAMGLDWKTQHRKLASHPVLSKAVVLMTIPWEGKGQPMIAIRLNRLSFWLATVQPDRIPDLSVRARVISFQEECADVLFRHFFGVVGKAVADPMFDEMKLKWINTAIRAGGAKAGRQMWIKVGAAPLPAILAAEKQHELPLSANEAKPAVLN